MGWRPWRVLSPGASPLSDETQGRTRLPSPRGPAIPLLPSAQGQMPSAHPSKYRDHPRGHTGQRLPLLSVPQGPLHRLRMAEAGSLATIESIFTRCQDSLHNDLDSGMYSVCLNTSRDGELTTSNSHDNSWHLLSAYLFSWEGLVLFSRINRNKSTSSTLWQLLKYSKTALMVPPGTISLPGKGSPFSRGTAQCPRAPLPLGFLAACLCTFHSHRGIMMTPTAQRVGGIEPPTCGRR